MLDRRVLALCANICRVCVCVRALQNLLEQRTQTFFAAFRWRCVRSTLKCALFRSLCRPVSVSVLVRLGRRFLPSSVLFCLISLHTHTPRLSAVYVYNIFTRRAPCASATACERTRPPSCRQLPFALAALRLLFQNTHAQIQRKSGNGVVGAAAWDGPC